MSNKVNSRSNPNLYCKMCEFQATRPAEFVRHIGSIKHQRDGLKLKDCDNKCEICEKIFSNHFALKIHKLQIHGTIEEKRQHKYYCETCDVIFLSQLFMDKHLAGKKHKNMLVCCEYQKKYNENITKSDKLDEVNVSNT